MRSKVVRTLALALLLIGVGMTAAQQSGAPPGSPGSRPPKQKAAPEKSKLEEMLAEALKNNPDIRVAAAKLAEADAELNRTRLQVTQKIVLLYHAIETQKKAVESAEKSEQAAKKVASSIPNELIDQKRAAVAREKAKLAELEAQLPALLGKERTSMAAETLLSGAVKWKATELQHVPVTAMFTFAYKAEINIPQAEKIRKALNHPISVEFKDRPVKEIVDALSKSSGVVIQFVEDRTAPIAETASIRCETMPLSAAVQLLGDSLPNYTIVVRDYGLLITLKENVPPGAMSLEGFLRRKPAEK